MRYTVFYLFVFFVLVFSACNNSDQVFKQIPSSQSGINFTNKPLEKQYFNILYYLYYYNGGGVATGDINNDGLTDIYFTANNKSGNKLFLNKGNFKFEDITQKAGVAGTADWCSGVTMADVNNDGYLDIYVSAISRKYKLQGNNMLYINNKNGTFTEEAEKYGLNFSGLTTQTAFFDYDNDGDLDCYLLNQSQQPHANIRDTSFRQIAAPLVGDKLFRNDLSTTGKFTDVTDSAGIYQSSLGYGLGLSVADFNNDGWLDIYIGNDFHENDYYYINNANGTFTESGAKHFRHYSRFSMGNDAADINNDGQLDLVTVDMLPPDEATLKTYGSDENPDTYKFKLTNNGYQEQFSRNVLQINNGNGESFSDVALMAGVSATDWSWAPLFADFDNDGNKDLFISSGIVKRPVDLDYIRYVSGLKMQGLDKTDKMDAAAIENMPDGSGKPYFFKGDGKLSFSEVSNNWGVSKFNGYYNGASYADLDNDGRLDMIINSLGAEAVILKNQSKKGNFISLEFRTDSANRFGYGTKAYVFSKGTIQYQQLMATRGFQSSVEPILHFGLGDSAVVDSVVVVWPGNQYQTIQKPDINKKLTVKKQPAGIYNYETFFVKPRSYFTNVSDSVGINWKHTENQFWDFNKQYLIPHMESARGPKIAVADVNGDGLDDFFACGSVNQGGALMIQQPNGSFVQQDTSIFNRLKMNEEVDAIFFHANKDSFPDLYVVSGGNEFIDGAPYLSDVLYINNGKGQLLPMLENIPHILKNKSCVTASDVDGDGDNDLFVGGLSNAAAFGVPQDSYLLINDGNGKFTQQPNVFKNLGIVTAAKFADINNDQQPDLVVTGEWMGIKIFMNNKGAFELVDLPNSTGLWQTLSIADVNGDGSLDILAGNWGYNSKLWAGKTSPLNLYVKDFDKNGSVEQIMTYKIGKEEYTFLAKDELERALPVLKKAYLSYKEVAGKTVQFMFFDLFKDYTKLSAETLGSAVFLNDGKGVFKKQELPLQIQQAPVMAFANLPDGNFLAAGNFFGTIPYEGRYDALQPSVFGFTNNNSVFLGLLPDLDGEVRDVKWIQTNKGRLLVIARNNNKLQFYKWNN